MKYSKTVELPVPAAQAWKTLSDVSRWADWTPTVERIDTEPGPVHEGQAVAIKQPGRKIAHYTIDVVDAGSRFRWGSSRGGVRQAAEHVVTSAGASSCRVELTFTMAGPLGAVLGVLGAAKIRGMVDAEAAALAKRFDDSDPKCTSRS